MALLYFYESIIADRNVFVNDEVLSQIDVGSTISPFSAETAAVAGDPK